jgi:hypothetical protein
MVVVVLVVKEDAGEDEPQECKINSLLCLPPEEDDGDQGNK